MLTCSQKGNGGCKDIALFRYTWPGRDEAYVCGHHAIALENIAGVIGMHLQLIPLTAMDHIGPEEEKFLADQKKGSAS